MLRITRCVRAPPAASLFLPYLHSFFFAAALALIASPALRVRAEGSSFGDEYKDDTYSANVAMLYYEDGDKPYFYFLRDLFKESKF